MNLPFSLLDIVDLVLAIALVEGAVLVVYRRRTGRGIGLHDFVANMVSGLCLMAALHAVVTGAGTPAVAAWLLGAGVAHVTDIVTRLRRGARRSLIERVAA